MTTAPDPRGGGRALVPSLAPEVPAFESPSTALVAELVRQAFRAGSGGSAGAAEPPLPPGAGRLAPLAPPPPVHPPEVTGPESLPGAPSFAAPPFAALPAVPVTAGVFTASPFAAGSPAIGAPAARAGALRLPGAVPSPEAAPSPGPSPILAYHGLHDSAADYYYLGGGGAAKPGPAWPAGTGAAFEAPTSARALAPAAPVAVRPLAGGAQIPAGFDVHAVRRDFPALHQEVNGKPLVWLDNAATTHKPQSVIDATSEFYERHNSNIHRAAHTLAARSTDLFEGARDKLRDFVGAASSREIVFLRGTTEAINLVANSYGHSFGPGDEIVVTRIEHHANIVPWQLLAQRTGAVLKVAPVDERGELQLDRFAALLGPRTRFVSVTHVANALGTVVPVEAIIALAHAHGVPVLVDAAQSSPHLPIDVRALDADFFVLSGHKIFGPTGIGILYGKERHLDAMPPWQGGGHMIRDVTFEKTEYQGLPEKFEAGTPDIAGAVGLGAAVDYLARIGLPAIAAYEHALLDYATERLGEVTGLRLIGTAPVKASVLSFVVEGFEPEQVSRHLDRHGIATRSGHHCAQPALRHFGLEQTVRASLAFYNTKEDVDVLIHALEKLPKR